MSQESRSNDRLTFAISLSIDRDHFFRRACAACGREFKTEGDPADLQWALASQCSRIGVEIGEQEEGETSADRLRCPFCEHEDAGGEMHTDETTEYLKRLVYREYVLPHINKMFSGLEDSLGRGNRSGGFFSISVQFRHSRSLLPPRPLHGPEPADFKIVEFLCCGKRVKVPEKFTDVRSCTFCGTDVAVV